MTQVLRRTSVAQILVRTGSGDKCRSDLGLDLNKNCSPFLPKSGFEADWIFLETEQRNFGTSCKKNQFGILQKSDKSCFVANSRNKVSEWLLTWFYHLRSKSEAFMFEVSRKKDETWSSQCSLRSKVSLLRANICVKKIVLSHSLLFAFFGLFLFMSKCTSYQMTWASVCIRACVHA